MNEIKWKAISRDYTIAGKGSPVWQLVEPAILKLSATGLLHLSLPRLRHGADRGYGNVRCVFVLLLIAKCHIPSCLRPI